ncbi:MAG: DUF5050 domain-containing protein [Methanoregula sp.]|nr:DUF5050 domain-containing protein [Methanoregula sp.]
MQKINKIFGVLVISIIIAFFIVFCGCVAGPQGGPTPKETPSDSLGGKPSSMMGKIAFLSSGGNLHLINPDGTNEVKLVDGAGGDFLWSPDGKRIVYNNVKGIVYNGISVINVDRTNNININKKTMLQGMWSSDGKKILFVEWSDDQNLNTIDSDGRNLITLIKDNSTYRPCCAFFSPDNKKIAYIISGPESNGLYIMNTDGTGQKKLTTGYVDCYSGGGTVYSSDLAWSPDGKSIAYSKDNTLHSINPDGTNEIQIALGTEPVWTPDGKKIIYRKDALFQVNPDGTNIKLITGMTPPWGHIPSFSPDGKNFVFSSDSSIYVFTTDGSGSPKQIASGYNPKWSPV